MVLRHKKKIRKYRATRTHGWGKQKRHRKSGTRGGVGNAAPTSHHWLQVVTGKRPPLGKKGFIRPPTVRKNTKQINVSHLESMLPTLIKEGKTEKKSNVFQINLKDLGYTKLLAQGEIKTSLHITVESASERAISKIEVAGGKVITEEKE